MLGVRETNTVPESMELGVDMDPEHGQQGPLHYCSAL